RHQPAGRPARAAPGDRRRHARAAEGARLPRLLHLGDRRDAGARLREGARRVSRVPPARTGSARLGDPMSAKDSHTYDAIVVGSGISGGWAAKELTEAGLRTLVLERGRNVEHVKDYPTADLDPWELP